MKCHTVHVDILSSELTFDARGERAVPIIPEFQKPEQ